MYDYIQVFKKDEPEYKKLEAAAELLTKKSPRGYTYYVGETYFDFGQNWIWTTILCKGGQWGSYQALSPRTQGLIIESEDLESAVAEILNGKFCPDRLEV